MITRILWCNINSQKNRHCHYNTSMHVYCWFFPILLSKRSILYIQQKNCNGYKFCVLLNFSLNHKMLWWPAKIIVFMKTQFACKKYIQAMKILCCTILQLKYYIGYIVWDQYSILDINILILLVSPRFSVGSESYVLRLSL